MSEPRRAATEPEDAAEADHERERRGSRRGLIAVLVALAVLLAGGAITYLVARQSLQEFASGLLGSTQDYPGPGQDEVEVVIPPGTSITGIGAILADAGVIASPEAFVKAAAQDSRATSVQAGTYRLALKLPAADALAMLLDPANLVRHTFTLREGYRLDQQVALMSKATGIEADEFDAVLAGVKGLGLPSWAKRSAEGFLFPDTYEYPSDPTALGVASLATARFTQVAEELDLKARAAQLDITPYQAVVVASIIEKEVFREADRPKVARVIYNRLAIGQRLGMDSTAAYASWRKGLKHTNYNLDSPWNTRVNPGLPPGPIGSPGRAALEAAVSPAEGDWLYFVTVDLSTGETEFSSDEAGFARSVKKWKKWCAASDANGELCGLAG